MVSFYCPNFEDIVKGWQTAQQKNNAKEEHFFAGKGGKHRHCKEESPQTGKLTVSLINVLPVRLTVCLCNSNNNIAEHVTRNPQFHDTFIDLTLQNFIKIANRIILTKSIHPRAAKPEVIQQVLPALSCDTIIIEDVQQALEYTLEHAKKDDIILACGSVFIAAAIRESWFEKFAEKNTQ